MSSNFVDVLIIQSHGDPTTWFVEGYLAGTAEPVNQPIAQLTASSPEHGAMRARATWGRRITSIKTIRR